MIGGLVLAATSPTPSPSPFEQLPAPGAHVPELIIGGVFALLGIRSLVRWMRTGFDAHSMRDEVLFSLHSAARVGVWFAFAGFFFGFALVDDVGPFVKWYLFVPLALAGIQLMTGVFLSRAPRESFRHEPNRTTAGPPRAGEARGNGRSGPSPAGGGRGGERPAAGEPGPR